MTHQVPGKARSRGFSLIEVVISLGLLTGVLVAIASMFVIGQSSVKRGRTMTEATAVAQHIMEDINKLSYNGLQIFFVGTPNLSTLTSYTTDTDTAGSYANTQYGSFIRSRLWKGHAVIVLTPIGGTVKPAVWNSGEAIRMTVTVHWSELGRDRSVSMEGVRF